MEHTELVAPGITQHPEVKAALLLMVRAGRAQPLQPSNLGLNIVGLQAQVHPFLGDLLVVGALEQHPDLGVGEPQQPVDGRLRSDSGSSVASRAADQNATPRSRSSTSMTNWQTRLRWWVMSART